MKNILILQLTVVSVPMLSQSHQLWQQFGGSCSIGVDHVLNAGSFMRDSQAYRVGPYSFSPLVLLRGRWGSLSSFCVPNQ